MELSDFLTVVVALNDKEESTYSHILQSVGLPEPEIVDRKLWNKPWSLKVVWQQKMGLANEVKEVVGDRPAIIMSNTHYPITSCYKEVPIIILDSHCDDEENHNNQVIVNGNSIDKFSNANFLLFREGIRYILGTKAKSKLSNIKTYRPSEVYNILDTNLPDRFLMSLEVDVFDHSVTTAYNPRYGQNSMLERIGRRLGYKGHLDEKTVLDLSKKLVHSRELAGLHIAGYDPDRDPGYKTAELLHRYLKGVLNEYLEHKPHKQVQPVQER